MYDIPETLGLPAPTTPLEIAADRELACMLAGGANPLLMFNIDTWLWCGIVEMRELAVTPVCDIGLYAVGDEI